MTNGPDERLVICENPHWVGDEPAWDITLTNGETHKDVTRKEIERALSELVNRGDLHHYSSYIDVVRQCHIDGYNKYHTSI